MNILSSNKTGNAVLFLEGNCKDNANPWQILVTCRFIEEKNLNKGNYLLPRALFVYDIPYNLRTKKTMKLIYCYTYYKVP